MEEVREDLLRILNQALELEHSAKIQYSTRAEMITAALTKIEEGHRVHGTREILEVNLSDENEAIIFYKWIRNKVEAYRYELQGVLDKLEGGMRSVIDEEQQHSRRLSLIIRQLEKKLEDKARFENQNKVEEIYTTK